MTSTGGPVLPSATNLVFPPPPPPPPRLGKSNAQMCIHDTMAFGPLWTDRRAPLVLASRSLSVFHFLCSLDICM